MSAKASFESVVLTRLATIEQVLKGLTDGDDGFHSFKREMKELIAEEHKRTTEAHLRLNAMDIAMKDKADEADLNALKEKVTKIMAWGSAILVAVQLGLKWGVK